MAEAAVGIVINYLTPLVIKQAKLPKGVHSQVLRIKRELESIQCFLKEADMRAETEADKSSTISTTKNDVKLWVKQLGEVSFRIEDIIDEYLFYLAQHPRHESGFIDSLRKFSGFIFKLKQRYRIASQIQHLKVEVCEIKDASTMYGFQSTGEGCRTTSDAVSWYDPRKGAMYLEESDVVGIESPRDELISWLLDDQQFQRTVIAVVGMGGLGKTTLTKKVYDSVKEKFDCHAWIAVSPSYQKEELLKNVIKKFCQGNNEPILEGTDSMDEEALIYKLRDYLQRKRYVVIFDDIWKVDFWGDIEHALLDNENGARIVITTRNMVVADFCKISSFVYVHKMQPLPSKKAWELFCSKVFKFGHGGQCPSDLLEFSRKIIHKCDGLPLAIVAIAGLLSTKNKTTEEWRKLHDSLSSELESNPHLTSITRILSLSYSDLPYHLKSCFLYFGMYPQNYSIRCSRMLRQWIAEGFVNDKKNKTLEEVGYEYLTELVHRSLVQLSYIEDQLTGKARNCHIHDLMHEVILKKMEDSSFCHVLTGNDERNLREGLVTRRLSIVNRSLDVLPRFDQISQVRSILSFNIIYGGISLDISLLRKLRKNFRLLKVLDFEDAPLDRVPEEIGNLFNLRFLSLRNTKVKKLPKSIGKLVNLDTLDLKQSLVSEIPTEINRLCKLRHLYGYHCDYAVDFCLSAIKGIKVEAGLGCLESLHGLRIVELNEVEVEVIKELGKLTKLRRLGMRIQKLRRQDGKVVCECIEKMKHLKSLIVIADSEGGIIDLDYMSSPPQYIQRVSFFGRCFRKLPEWTTKLQSLVRLRIGWSKLEDDQVKTLKTLHNLVELAISYDSYVGERLQFEIGVFPNLKFLSVTFLSGLKWLMIEEGALVNLENLSLGPSPLMKEVPSASGIHHLKKLQYLRLNCMPDEFVNALRPHGQYRQIVEHIPVISIASKVQGGKFDFLFL